MSPSRLGDMLLLHLERSQIHWESKCSFTLFIITVVSRRQGYKVMFFLIMLIISLQIVVFLHRIKQGFGFSCHWKAIAGAQNACESSSCSWIGIKKQTLAWFASLRTSILLMHVMSLESLRLMMHRALHSLPVLLHQPSSFSV